MFHSALVPDTAPLWQIGADGLSSGRTYVYWAPQLTAGRDMCSASPFWPHSRGSTGCLFLAPRLANVVWCCRHVLVLQALPAQVMRANAQGSATVTPTPKEPGAASPPSDRAIAQANGVAGTPLGGVQAAAAQPMPKALPDEADGELQCIVCSITYLSVDTKHAHPFSWRMLSPSLPSEL